MWGKQNHRIHCSYALRVSGSEWLSAGRATTKFTDLINHGDVKPDVYREPSLQTNAYIQCFFTLFVWVVLYTAIIQYSCKPCKEMKLYAVCALKLVLQTNIWNKACFQDYFVLQKFDASTESRCKCVLHLYCRLLFQFYKVLCLHYFNITLFYNNHSNPLPGSMGVPLGKSSDGGR